MSKEHLKIRKGVLFTPQLTAPSDPSEGDAYFDAVLGLRLYRNGVWQSAGGAGEIKVDLVDRSLTVLPTIVPTSIDGVIITTGTRVLFTALSANNDRVYKATVGASISWSQEPDFGGSTIPSSGDVVRVKFGTVYKLTQFIYDSGGGGWLWSLVDYDNFTIGSTTERLTKLWVENVDTKSVTSVVEALDIDYTGGVFGNSATFTATGNWHGQSFTPNSTGTLTRIDIDINPLPAIATFILDVYTDDGADLPLTYLTSSNVLNATVGGLQTFTFSGITLNAGTKYVFILNCSAIGGGSGNIIFTTSGTYAGGKKLVSFDGGSTWQVHSSAWDMRFAVYLTTSGTGPNIRMNALTSGYIDLLTPTSVTSYNLTLPAAQGTVGQVLTNNGSGVLSWSTIAATLQDAYNNDPDGGDVYITTNSTDGSLIIAGTESLEVSADGGLNVSGGMTQTLSTRMHGSTSGYVDLSVPAITTSYGIIWPATQSNVGQLLANNGSGQLSWVEPFVGFNPWVTVNSNTVAAAFDDFGVDTSSNTVQITLPATPSNGTRVRVIDISGSFASFSCFIATTDLSTIENLVQPLEIDINNVWAELAYDSANNNWVIYGPLAVGGGGPTFQDIYTGDPSNLPVQLTTTAGQGDFEITGTEQLRVTSTKGLLVGGLSSTPRLSFAGSTSGILGVKVPAVVTPYDITLPPAVGTAGQYLQTDASGVLSWATVTIPTVTLQSAYIGSNILTSSGPEGNISFGGTEKFEVTTTRGMLISSPGSSGEPTFHVLNSGTIAEAVLIGHNSTTTIKDALSITNAGLGIGIKLLNTNAGNTDSALEITNTANTSSITINQNGNSQGLVVIQSVTATSAAMRLVAQNAQNRQIDMQSSGGGTLGFRTSSGTVGHNYTWPATQAIGTQILENNGSGILSWVTAPTPPTVSMQAAYDGGKTILYPTGSNPIILTGVTGTSDNLIRLNQNGSGSGANAIRAVANGGVGIYSSSTANNAFVGEAYTSSIAVMKTTNTQDGSHWDMTDNSGNNKITWKTPVSITTHSLTMPGVQGGVNTSLINNGSGILSWVVPTVYLANVVEDTTPQLGGDLDLNTYKIITTDNAVADANPTGSLSVTTGNKTAGTGDSGDITLTTGTTVDGNSGDITLTTGIPSGAGTRGNIVVAAKQLSFEHTVSGDAVWINKSSGNGDALKITKTTASGNGIQIDTSTTHNDVAIQINQNSISSGGGVNINQPNATGTALTINTGGAYAIFSGGTGTIHNSVTSDGAEAFLGINNHATEPTMSLRNTNTSGELIDLLGASSGILGIKVPNAVSSYDITLPGAVASAGQVLTDVAGNGVLSWAVPPAASTSSAGTVSFEGTSVTTNNQWYWSDTNGVTTEAAGAATATLRIHRVGKSVTIIIDAWQDEPTTPYFFMWVQLPVSWAYTGLAADIETVIKVHNGSNREFASAIITTSGYLAIRRLGSTQSFAVSGSSGIQDNQAVSYYVP